ncbi:MAG: hypothetical protein IPM26_14875 [Saprospiraceae bacterium]|nr:hypothetical protein [Saprospiraceae bacterium]
MEDKIQQLTDRLYEQGIKKAKEEAEAIVSKANEEAARIKEDARIKSEAMLAEAQSAAQELHQNAIGEIQLAAEQSIKILKQKITHLITLEALEKPVHKTLKDDDFIARLILHVVDNWHAHKDGKGELNIEISDSYKIETVEYLKNRIHEILGEGFRIETNSHIGGGFVIGPSEANYRISFTDKDFTSFFNALLKQKTMEILYAEK